MFLHPAEALAEVKGWKCIQFALRLFCRNIYSVVLVHKGRNKGKSVTGIRSEQCINVWQHKPSAKLAARPHDHSSHAMFDFDFPPDESCARSQMNFLK